MIVLNKVLERHIVTDEAGQLVGAIAECWRFLLGSSSLLYSWRRYVFGGGGRKKLLWLEVWLRAA